jgi:hypothetical protein
VTDRQPGLHQEATRAPTSFAKSQCGVPPTASIPKTRDQPEEPTSKRARPSGNNTSIGKSRVPPTRQQMRGPTNDRQDAPDLDAGTTTGDARTKKANRVRAGRPHPAANHRQVVRPSCLPRVASHDDRSRPRDQVGPPPAEMGWHPVHTLYRCGTGRQPGRLSGGPSRAVMPGSRRGLAGTAGR